LPVLDDATHREREQQLRALVVLQEKLATSPAAER
jgi:hypothetical protein